MRTRDGHRLPRHPCRRERRGIGEEIPHLAMQRSVVALESQQVVCLRVADGNGDLLLAAHRVEAHRSSCPHHHAPLHIDLTQQFGNSVISLVFESTSSWPRGSPLAVTHALMSWSVSDLSGAMTAGQRFSVDGQQFLAEPPAERGSEPGEALPERLRVERVENAAESIIARLPLGSFSHWRSQSSRSSAKGSKSSKSSYPADHRGPGR